MQLEMKQVMFRFPKMLVERLDAHLAREHERGRIINRSAVVRTFLEDRLDEEEAKAKRRERRRAYG